MHNKLVYFNLMIPTFFRRNRPVCIARTATRIIPCQRAMLRYIANSSAPWMISDCWPSRRASRVARSHSARTATIIRHSGICPNSEAAIPVRIPPARTRSTRWASPVVLNARRVFWFWTAHCRPPGNWAVIDVMLSSIALRAPQRSRWKVSDVRVIFVDQIKLIMELAHFPRRQQVQ